jgi:putative Mg2+ transporter-C (MgtC) family protein
MFGEILLVKIITAMLLGALIGVERTIAHKHAGMRTFALVSVGSALFVIITKIVFEDFYTVANVDPVRIISSVVTGVGFIGAGMILMQKDTLRGLTTAAGLWVTAGVGVAVGFGFYYLALSVSVVTVFIFTGMWLVEEKIRSIFHITRGTQIKKVHKKK